MAKLIQIIPVVDCRLFGHMVQKEVDLNKKNQGTFYRSGAKQRDRAKWSHKKYKGWINLQRTHGEVVTIEIKSRSQSSDDWQLYHAFLGWLDRHFSRNIKAIHVHYQDE
jgi:hypothetical protein